MKVAHDIYGQDELVTSSELQETNLGRQLRGAKAQKGKRDRLVILSMQFLVMIFILTIWQFVLGRWIGSYILSSPSEIVRTLFQYLGTATAWHDIEVTVIEFVLGYIIGVASGALLGIVLAQSGFASAVFVPLIAAVNGIPKIALAPIFLLLLGLGVWSKIAIAAMSVFFIMFYNLYSGIRSAPKPLVDVLRVFGAPRSTIIRYVLIPAVTPSTIAGLRAGIPFSMIGVIVGEFIASNAGLGYYINQQTQQFNTAGTFAGIIIIVVIVLIGNLLVNILEARALRWQ